MPNNKFDLKKDLSEDKYHLFARESKIDADLDKTDILTNIKIIQKNKMTNAGTLMFGNHGSHYLISSTITCALFQGTDKFKVLDQKIYDDDIYTNYQNVIIYLLSHLNAEYIIGINRENKLELPPSLEAPAALMIP